MSSGPSDARRQPVVYDEDDWFATSPLEPDERTPDLPDWHEEEVPEVPPRADNERLGRRQALVALAVIGAVILGGGGILLARSLGGSDAGTSVTPTTPVVTTTPLTDTAPTTATQPQPSTTPTTPAPADTTASSPASVPTTATLRAGDKGDSVKALQETLIAGGFAPGTADGNFGPSTTAAVAAFQKANGLTVDGVAGPATIAAINSAVASG